MRLVSAMFWQLVKLERARLAAMTGDAAAAKA